MVDISNMCSMPFRVIKRVGFIGYVDCVGHTHTHTHTYAHIKNDQVVEMSYKMPINQRRSTLYVRRENKKYVQEKVTALIEG